MVVDLPATTEDAARVSVGAAGRGSVAVRVTVLAPDVPTELEQVKLNVSAPAEVGVIVWLPLVGSVPVQFPDAMQLEASLDDHVRVVELPTVTVVWANASVGAEGATPTARVTELAACSPIPL
jgi:hypothetical protein